ncbi:hypothetical protein [Streptomyces sp. NPDC051636]|uniref:hypothetical protein n=1 Tax=Streptomyces sp. NPDC051636 TaxID=3365663 RepID=UPI003796BFE6
MSLRDIAWIEREWHFPPGYSTHRIGVRELRSIAPVSRTETPVRVTEFGRNACRDPVTEV